MNQNKTKLLTYLQSQDLLTLATANTTPTASTLYYGIDQSFNIFIVTPPSTEHGKHITKNPHVACAIVDTSQKQFLTTEKIGVQIKGVASQITDREEMKEALSIWSKGKKDIVDMYITNITTNKWESRPYVIKPEKIKWFNEELYGEEGTKIFTF